MKNLNIKNLVILTSALILSGVCNAGYSQKNSNTAAGKDGIKLGYNYPAGKSFKYQSDTKIVQDLDANGQTMQVNISVNLACQVTGSGKQGENLKLEIKIDSMANAVESPQGSMGGQINELKGKIFSMMLAPTGKVADLTEASKIVYNAGSGEANISQQFRNFFPGLPEGIIKAGDTWIVNDTVNSNAPNDSLFMPQKAVYKFEGIENVDGIECARITAELSGDRKMTTESGGMQIHIKGPFTGTLEILFGLKEGCLVKETVTTKMTGTMELADQGMTLPDVMTVTATIWLVK